jgi:hypothetical protein
VGNKAGRARQVVANLEEIADEAEISVSAHKRKQHVVKNEESARDKKEVAKPPKKDVGIELPKWWIITTAMKGAAAKAALHPIIRTDQCDVGFMNKHFRKASTSKPPARVGAAIKGFPWSRLKRAQSYRKSTGTAMFTEGIAKLTKHHGS